MKNFSIEIVSLVVMPGLLGTLVVVITLFACNEMFSWFWNKVIMTVNQKRGESDNEDKVLLSFQECYRCCAYIISGIFSVTIANNMYEGLSQNIENSIVKSILFIIFVIFADILSSVLSNQAIDKLNYEIKAYKKQNGHNEIKHVRLIDRMKRAVKKEKRKLQLANDHSDCRLYASIIVLIYLLSHLGNGISEVFAASFLLAFVSSFFYYDTTLVGLWEKIKRLISYKFFIALFVTIILFLWIEIYPGGGNALEILAGRSFMMLAALAVCSIFIAGSYTLDDEEEE